MANTHDFPLLCAYPIQAFGSPDCGDEFRRICDQLSTVSPSEGYAMLGGADAQQRTLALLQQQALALKVEVDRLRADQVHAELAYADVRQATSEADRRRHPKLAATAGGCASGRHRDSAGLTPVRVPGGRLLVEPIATLASRIGDAELVDKSAGQTAGTRPG